MKPRTALGIAALGLAAAIAVSASGCGSSQSAPSSPPLSLRVCNPLISASLAIAVAPTTTARLKSKPRDIARAKQLLKPLTVAKTLQVNSSNQVAGGFITSLYDKLDTVEPGLTKQGAKGEQLDAPTVNRFLRYASKQPTLVAEPTVAHGVKTLEPLLRGKQRKLDLSSCGGGLTTAEKLVSDAKRQANAFWPPLSKQLAALEASLR